MKVIILTLIATLMLTSLVYGQSAEKMQTLYDEGLQLANRSDFYGAARKWEAGLEIAKKVKLSKAISAFLGSLGVVYSKLGDYQKAISYDKEALKINREIRDTAEVGYVLENLGRVYYDLGAYQRAIPYYEEALHINKEIGDKQAMGGTLSNLGAAYWKLRDNQKAISYYQEAAKLKKEIGDKTGLGTTLTDLAIVHRNLGDYQKALSYNEEALKIDREIGDKKGVGNNLANLGAVYDDLGDHQKALSFYEEALKIHREIGDKKGVGDDLTGLGAVYSDLGDYQKALSYYEEALKIKREIGDKKGVGNNLTNLGNVYSDLGDYPKAISSYEEALKVHGEMRDKNGVGADLSNLGIVYDNLGDYQKALSYHEQALRIKREIGDKKGVGTDLTNLGVVYDNLGDYQKALSYYGEALKIKREIGDKKGVGMNLGNLGNVYSHLGDYQKAISYYEEALKIKREIGDKNGVGTTLGNFGGVYLDIGDYQKAISHLEEALKIHKEIGDKQGVGTNLGNLGIVYSYLGDYQKALSSYEEALRIDKEIGDRKGAGRNLTNLGVVYKDLGDYQKALSYFEEALKIDKEIGVPTRTDEANIADIHLELGEVDKAQEEYLKLGQRIRLGRLNLTKKSYTKGIEYFEKELKDDIQSRDASFLFAEYCGLGEGYSGTKDYQRARENFDKAITLTEEQREGLGGSEKSRFFVAKVLGFYRIQPYEGIVRTHIALSQNNDAFFYSENLKARVLSEAIASGYSGVTRALPPDLAKEEEMYLTKIRGFRKEMEALYKNNQMDTYYEREKELKETKSKQEIFVTKLRKTRPEYAAINYPQPIKPAEVKLNNNEVLIEFEVTEEKTYVLLLRNGRVEAREAPISRKEFRELVLKYRTYFEGIQKSNGLLEYKADVGKQLYSVLFGTMLDAVPEGTTLIIVPDEFLGVLPFEALVTEMPKEEKIGEGEYGPFPLGVKYLADKYLISYAQSATSLSLLRSLKKGATTSQSAFAVCDPIFSANDSRVARLSSSETNKQSIRTMGAIKDWRKMGVAGVKGKGGERIKREEELFPRLEKTGEIGKGMMSLFGTQANILIGENAKEEKVVATDLSAYKYLVFATHGILDRSVPWIREPALVLTQVGNSEKYDGFLTMTEVMGLKTRAEVVALTACETGVGENVTGEGVMGMGRAFQYAGCENVVMSLWSVAEDATVKLSNAFFTNLKSGKSPKEALRLARNEIRRQGYEHPFYWAAFVLYGM